MGYITGSKRLEYEQEYSRPGLTISGAITYATEDANKSILNGTGHKLDFIVAETFGVEVRSVASTADLWRGGNVSVYIGPQEYCVHEAFMAAAFNMPMISYFCTTDETSNKKKFPTFARTRPPDTQISKSVASVFLHFNWTEVVLLYLNSQTEDFKYSNIAANIKLSLESVPSMAIHVTSKSWDTVYHDGYTDNNPFIQLVEDTYLDTRIYLIVGHHYEHVGLMMAMERRNLFDNGEYFVVGVDIEQYDANDPDKYLRGLLKDKDKTDPVAEAAFRNYLGIVPSSPVGFKAFSAKVNTYMEMPPFKFPNASIPKVIRAEAAYLYDAVYLYAKALKATLEAGADVRDGTAIINRIKRTHYKSAMGYMVYINENGDAEGNYTLLARKCLPNATDVYGLYPVAIFDLSPVATLPILNIMEPIDWLNGEPPIAVPPCGFRGEKCISHTVEITCGIAGSILLIFLIISLVLYRNWKYEQELDSLLWKVDFRDIQMNEDANAMSFGPKITTKCVIRTSQVSLSSNPDADFRYSSIFTQIGIYKGRVFAIKMVQKRSIDITREMKKELKMMRDLRHDNLNAFIGACTDPPNICIVTEYCTRGSLKDILENEDVKLDNMFIASLVGDILRGMIYLHDSPVRFHGNLHTANCLVDSRWVVKLSDFGLKEFKRGSEECHTPLTDSTRILDRCRLLLYRAPELLRQASAYLSNPSLSPCGTPKGDVYSFGVILYELHSRHGPFGDTGLSPAEILNRLVNCDSIVPFRPNLESLENSFDFVRDCLKECWVEQPEDRPDFKTIRTKLRPLRKGMKPNIFDNMMAMMEKYTNNLEALVDERTDQLQEEKKKTEALLYEMLPRPVAEQLKKGNKVEAESFDCVTIYFSDIIGFTAMSAESTPLQVVDFLNDLYTCFDSIIENYDVYKVETIGDAYMVVSGLPLKNDKQHAAEIATMSLHLLSMVKNFKIRHRPSEGLKLRIGIHSGPVCAGVVGLKMPRYCLFGDTVNTASRMESTGTAQKIHCSQECQRLLMKINGYHLVERGLVPMKGKADQVTYYLVGEDKDQRRIRSDARERRRALASGRLRSNLLDTNGHCIMPRSSLKKNHHQQALLSQQAQLYLRSPIPRCSSFDSPKKLRFANNTTDQIITDIISDDSPINTAKKSSNSLIENSCCSEWRTSSTSCPCIENLANSTATLAQFQLSSMFSNHQLQLLDAAPLPRKSFSSFPTLGHCLSVPKVHGIHTLSAPASPRHKESFDCSLARYPECEEVIPWIDSTPLLRISTAESTTPV